MTYNRINGYLCMWVFVMFDLPTKTKKERSDAAKFRKGLEKDGFVMHQFSIYKRPCPSLENALVHVRRVEKMLPEKGEVTILTFTDKQYGKALVYRQRMPVKKEKVPLQLEIF